MGNGAPKPGAAFFPPWMEEGGRRRLPCVGRMRVHNPRVWGAPPVLGLGCEAALGWCLPKCGCVCPKPLQHLCIRMCSSLSSLLACALPRSLPTATPVPGEGIFFFIYLFFFPFCLYLTCHSARTSQGGRVTCSIMHNSCFSLASLAAAPPSPQQKPLVCAHCRRLPCPWGQSRCGAGGTEPPAGGLKQERD